MPVALIESLDKRDWHRGLPGSAPPADELAPVGVIGLAERVPDQIQLAPVERLIAGAAQELETQENKIGVGRVRFAILPDVVDPSRLIRFPDLRSVHSDLARKSQEPGQLVQLHVIPRLVESKQLHEIEVTLMIAADVVVEFEIAIVLAHVPVARRRHAMYEAAVVKHRQIEPAAVPGN